MEGHGPGGGSEEGCWRLLVVGASVLSAAGGLLRVFWVESNSRCSSGGGRAFKIEGYGRETRLVSFVC